MKPKKTLSGFHTKNTRDTKNTKTWFSISLRRPSDSLITKETQSFYG